MNKIITLESAVEISGKLKLQSKKIVITGGVFDILHIGHLKLLQESKKQGDSLIVLVENDEDVKKIKGKDRPINPQEERAEIIAALEFVDYVVTLPEMKSNKDWDDLVYKLMPDIITTTQDDSQAVHNQRQAEKINARVVFVTKRIKNKSTTNLAKIISEKFDK